MEPKAMRSVRVFT